jgi:hypothetical protein
LATTHSIGYGRVITIAITPTLPIMAAVNLHTLHSDILYELLITCWELVSLRRLILTHPALHHAFNQRRRLILRTVFQTQNNVRSSHRLHEQELAAAHQYILRITASSAIDRVALREALWPELKRLMPAKLPSKWATALLACYHQAGLQDDALLFAKDTISIVLAASQPLYSEQRTLARAVIRTYTAVKLSQEAIELEETILRHLNPRLPEHSVWAKQLINTYRNNGHDQRTLCLQLDCWELYKSVVGSGSEVALDWARSIVRSYQLKGEDGKAIKFHQTIWSLLDPTTAQYVAWSRQLIQMHQKSNQPDEALVVTEEVCRHLRPDITGYRAWAAQLSEQYDTLGKPGDALAVIEAAWTGIAAHLARFPKDVAWRYRARGAGLMLAKAYRRHQRTEDANALEAKCKDLGI